MGLTSWNIFGMWKLLGCPRRSGNLQASGLDGHHDLTRLTSLANEVKGRPQMDSMVQKSGDSNSPVEIGSWFIPLFTVRAFSSMEKLKGGFLEWDFWAINSSNGMFQPAMLVYQSVNFIERKPLYMTGCCLRCHRVMFWRFSFLRCGDKKIDCLSILRKIQFSEYPMGVCFPYFGF